jgi:hypothetical protein
MYQLLARPLTAGLWQKIWTRQGFRLSLLTAYLSVRFQSPECAASLQTRKCDQQCDNGNCLTILAYNHDSDKSRRCGRGVPELPEISSVSGQGLRSVHAARNPTPPRRNEAMSKQVTSYCQVKSELCRDLYNISLFSHSLILFFQKKICKWKVLEMVTLTPKSGIICGCTELVRRSWVRNSEAIKPVASLTFYWEDAIDIQGWTDKILSAAKYFRNG